jgi:hypothetical protein
MSYLITSNTALTNVQFPTQEGMNNPSSYINQLQETHEIPINSEIALSSVKVSKDGLISLNRNNNKLYTYYGELLSSTKAQDQVTSRPIQAYITNDMNLPQNAESYTVDQLAEVTQKSLRRSMFHPSLQISNMNTSSVLVVPKRNASDTGFEGYEICVTSASSLTNDDTKISITWQPASSSQDGLGFDSADGQVGNSTNDEILTLIGSDYPLSLVGGEFNTNIEDLSSTAERKSDWSVGLTRCTRFKTSSGAIAPSLESPSWFDDNHGGAMGGGGHTFFDYVAKSEVVAGKTLLKLYQALYDDNQEVLEMNEFDYRLSRTGSTEYVDMNASTIDNIIWTVTGEQVKCQIVDDNGTTDTLVSGTNANTVLNMKPINQNTWCLFPKLSVPKDVTFEVEKFDGVDITGWVYGSEILNSTTGRSEQVYCDWYAQTINLGGGRDIEYCKPIDARYMNVSGNTTAYTQKGLALNGTVNYSPVFILAESTLYTPTRFASCGRLLGFPNRSILSAPTTQQQTTVCFVSDTVPQMISTGSLFVRLKNMTFSSFNMAKGSSSKIMYHLPRFDNSGSEFGALFFEPNERMYLKLNNVQPLMLNDIHVELVEPDERIAKNLTGKTICCFHIRESK